jgi:hypothetical protein
MMLPIISLSNYIYNWKPPNKIIFSKPKKNFVSINALDLLSTCALTLITVEHSEHGNL